MVFELPTNGQEMEIQITIKAHTPCVMKFISYDASRAKTIYFNRNYGWRNLPGKQDELFSGEKTFSFPMPITPGKLTFQIDNDVSSKNIEIVKIEDRKLNKKGLWLTPADQDFLKLAFSFAQESGWREAGRDIIYGSDSKKFLIYYLPNLVSRETGKVLSTPARISHDTGIIEVSAEKFRGYTVFMRVMILLHEYFHFKYNVRDEATPDWYAIEWFLSLGFPQTEAMYAFTKVFKVDPNNKLLSNAILKRETDNINHIRNFYVKAA